MAEIKDIIGRQIFDSRGNPTVEAEVMVENSSGKQNARACVPSGASTGALEAIELRDGSDSYRGKGVSKAIDNVNNIIKPKLIGLDCTQQEEIDKIMLELDGTNNKSNLGANAILSVSMAVARAAAKTQNVPLYVYLGNLSKTDPSKLPIPVLNIINGGEHAGNELDFQEFMMIPSGAGSFAEAMQIGVETYAALKDLLKKRYGPQATNVGDEGGFAPPLINVEDPLDVIIETLKELGYDDKVKLGMDVAASQFYKDNKYTVAGKEMDTAGLLEVYKEMVSKYPIVSIEDPFDEEDWEGFTLITKELGGKIQIVGDDLFVTNIERIKIGIEKGSCNSVLLKVNQIGSVTESINAALYSFDNNYGIMVSHRSGETGDPFIADLSVALNCGQIKSGAPARSDRTSKYNQLLRIEEQLGSKATYGSVRFLSG
jgi:enolase